MTGHKFTDADLEGNYLYCDVSQLVDAPLWYHKQGRQQTASGYGRKLTSPWKINFNGKLYRIYICIFSNAGTAYFTTKGKEIIVST